MSVDGAMTFMKRPTVQLWTFHYQVLRAVQLTIFGDDTFNRELAPALRRRGTGRASERIVTRGVEIHTDSSNPSSSTRIFSSLNSDCYHILVLGPLSSAYPGIDLAIPVGAPIDRRTESRRADSRMATGSRRMSTGILDAGSGFARIAFEVSRTRWRTPARASIIGRGFPNSSAVGAQGWRQ